MNQKVMIYLILSLFMTALIWFNSSLNADLSSAQSGFVVKLVDNVLVFIGIKLEADILSFYVRKAAHFGQFFILGMLWFQTFFKLKKTFKRILITLLIGSLTAVIDETIQRYSPGRAFMVFDIMLDIFGVISGMIFLIVLNHLIKHKKARHMM